MEGTATRVEHDRLYSGRVVGVDRDRVRLPSGHEAQMEVVRHRGSVVLLPMPDPQHLILVRQYRYPIDRWIWELAAGCVEPGEDPADGAARECEEETGLIAGRVEPLGRFYPSPGYCDECMNFFRLTELGEPTPDRPAASPDPDEDIRIRCFAIDEVRAMIACGDIQDLKTVAGLALLGP